MTKEIATETSLRLGLGLVLALAAACDEGAASPETDDSFRAVGAVLPIDDFRTGPVQIEIDTVDSVQTSQWGTGILGGNWRCLELGASVNAYDRPLSVEVREDENGYLALESGVGIHQSMSLIYGPGEDCGPAGLSLDFTPYTHLRLEFASQDGIYGAIDQGLGGGIVVWSSGGTKASSIVLSIDPDTKVKDFALADFEGDVEWDDVFQIDIVMQSGGPVPAYDYILKSFSAVELVDE